MNAPEVLSRPHLVKLTVKDFLILNDVGAFDQYARTELIGGDIWVVNALYSRHARIQSLLLRMLGTACDAIGGGIEAWVDGSVALGGDSMPQPDILIVATPIDQGPVPVDLLRIAIEVADTSLAHDLGLKAKIFAEAGVPEYWVADAEGRVIHQLWSPIDGEYAKRRQVAFGHPVTAATMPALAIETDRL